MGNCLKHQSSTKYKNHDDGDNSNDYDFLEKKKTEVISANKIVKEVKIKISKKQLEELLSKVDVRELRVEQVLSQLMDHSGEYQSLQSPWRPALQSIPEVN